MPHAENDNMPSQTLTNGEAPQSQFLSHLASYPLAQDTIKTYKSNPYGSKSIELAHSTYYRFAAPFVPYLKTPWSYVAPYATKADSLADGFLKRIDEKYPVVKEETETVKEKTLETALYPVKRANEGKQHVYDTYNTEAGKVGGKGYQHTFNATISTGLKLLQETTTTVHQTVQQTLESLRKFFGEKRDDLVQTAQTKKNQVVDKVNETVSKVNQTANDTANEAKAKTNGEQQNPQQSRGGSKTKSKKAKQQNGGPAEAWWEGKE